MDTHKSWWNPCSVAGLSSLGLVGMLLYNQFCPKAEVSFIVGVFFLCSLSKVKEFLVNWFCLITLKWIWNKLDVTQFLVNVNNQILICRNKLIVISINFVFSFFSLSNSPELSPRRRLNSSLSTSTIVTNSTYHSHHRPQKHRHRHHSLTRLTNNSHSSSHDSSRTTDTSSPTPPTNTVITNTSFSATTSVSALTNSSGSRGRSGAHRRETCK